MPMANPARDDMSKLFSRSVSESERLREATPSTCSIWLSVRIMKSLTTTRAVSIDISSEEIRQFWPPCETVDGSTDMVTRRIPVESRPTRAQSDNMPESESAGSSKPADRCMRSFFAPPMTVN